MATLYRPGQLVEVAATPPEGPLAWVPAMYLGKDRARGCHVADIAEGAAGMALSDDQMRPADGVYMIALKPGHAVNVFVPTVTAKGLGYGWAPGTAVTVVPHKVSVRLALSGATAFFIRHPGRLQFPEMAVGTFGLNTRA